MRSFIPTFVFFKFLDSVNKFNTDINCNESILIDRTSKANTKIIISRRKRKRIYCIARILMV